MKNHMVQRISRAISGDGRHDPHAKMHRSEREMKGRYDDALMAISAKTLFVFSHPKA
jgi:hypothetical protein